jgi:hypothetical protein
MHLPKIGLKSDLFSLKIGDDGGFYMNAERLGYSDIERKNIESECRF